MPWNHHESMAMRYINYFAIDEDDQFEIAGIFRTSRNCTVHLNEDPTNQLHLLWAGQPYGHCGYNLPFEKEVSHLGKMTLYGCDSAMASLLSMSKVNCVTKERFENYHNKTNLPESEDFTVGDDLETFIRRIKKGKITQQSIPDRGEEKVSHLFRLLDKEERRKLDMKDQDFLHTFRDRNDADVPEGHWKNTDYKHLKFSYSWAYRRTTFVNQYTEQIDSD